MKISSKYSIIIPTSSPSAHSHPLHPLPYFRITQPNKLQGPTPTNLPHPTPGEKPRLPIHTRKQKQTAKKETLNQRSMTSRQPLWNRGLQKGPG